LLYSYESRGIKLATIRRLARGGRGERNAFRIVEERPEGKRLLGGPDNIQVDFTEIKFKIVE